MPTTDRGRRSVQQRRRPVLSLPGSASNHASINDNASLSLGAGVTAFSIIAWNRARPGIVLGALVCKGTISTAATHEYSVAFNGSQQYESRLSDGVSLKTIAASSFGVVESGTLNMVAATWDGTNSFISVNAGPQNSVGAAVTIQDSTNHLRIGAREDGFLNTGADMGPVLIYKARTLTLDEIAFLYNKGRPLTYAELPDGYVTSLVAAWDWSDRTAVDKSGNGNDLTLTSGLFYSELRPYGADQA